MADSSALEPIAEENFSWHLFFALGSFIIPAKIIVGPVYL